MTSKRDALRGKTATEAVCEPQPHEVWDAAITGLDIVKVIHELEWCLNKRKMSLEQADEHVNGQVYVMDVQHFIRLNYLNHHTIEVYYMHRGVKVGFECAVKGLSQLRKGIQKIRSNNNETQ